MVCSPCCKRLRRSPVFAKPNPWPKRIGFILVAAILTFIVWSWRCFVKLSGIGNREGAMSEMFRLAAFHLLLAPLLLSYLRCVFTDTRYIVLPSHHDGKVFVILGESFCDIGEMCHNVFPSLAFPLHPVFFSEPNSLPPAPFPPLLRLPPPPPQYSASTARRIPKT